LLTNRGVGPTDARGGSAAETDVGKEGRKTSQLFEATLLSTAILLGTNPVAVKYAVGYIPPLPFAALRFVLAGLVLLTILRLLDSKKRRIRRKDFWALEG
jgi:drug/metabolite transporter (DMT)-like permease